MTFLHRTLIAGNNLNSSVLSTTLTPSSTVDSMFSSASGTTYGSATMVVFTSASSSSTLSSLAAMPFGTILARALWTYFGPLIFVIGVVGNILILVVMSRQHMRGTTTSIYLRWMAAADLCVLITGMITEWLEAYLGIIFKEVHPAACKLEKFAFYTSGDASIWICVAFTVDRFFAVCFPLDKRRIRACSKTTAHTTAAIATLASVAKNLHVLWTRGAEYQLRLIATTASTNTSAGVDGNNVTAFVEWTQVSVLKSNCGKPTAEYREFETYVRPLIALILVMVVPFVIIIVCNFFIVFAMIRLRSARRRSSVIVNSADGNVFQMTALCLSASFCFLVCVTPSMILLIGKPYWNEPPTDWYAIAKAITNQIFFINHSINFFLYCLTGQRFRVTLFIICRCTPGADLDRFFSTDAAAAFGFGPLSSSSGPSASLALGASGLTAAVLCRTSTPQSAPPCRRRSTPIGPYVKNPSTVRDAYPLSTAVPLLGLASAASRTSIGYLVDVETPSSKRSPKPVPSSRKKAAAAAASAIASKSRHLPADDAANKCDDVSGSRRMSTPVLWYAELQQNSFPRRPSFESIV